MTRMALGLCVALLAFGILSTLLALALRPLFRRAAGRLWRSEALLALRFAPTLGAAFVAFGVVFPAFARFEPHHTEEEIGAEMMVAAAAVLALLAAGAVRGARALHAGRRLRRSLAAGAEPIDLAGAPAPAYAIDSEFPLVALVGALRPRLFIARRVLSLCTPEELAAILAHEQGHLARRDNLMQLLVRSCPDVLSWTPAGARLEAAWEDACDRAADDHGARGGRRDDLASALVKVARAVPAPLPTTAPFFAFYRQDAVAVRVRRLLDEPAAPRGFTRRDAIVFLHVVTLGALLLDNWDRVLRTVHTATEAVVLLLQ